MPVQEFECQIARGQIGRYLNGEGLSSEALRQLGAHVAECSECKTFLDHRKHALQGMLGETAMPTHQEMRAVVDLNPSEALIAQIRARSVAEEPEAPATKSGGAKQVKPIFTKPIIYCGVLAIVLVGMTYMTRNPSGLLGPHASDLVAAAPTKLADSKALTTPPEKPKATATPPPTTPTPEASKAPTPAAAKPEASTDPKATQPGVETDSTFKPPTPVDAKSTETAASDLKSTSTPAADAEKSTGVTIAPGKHPQSPIVTEVKPEPKAQASAGDNTNADTGKTSKAPAAKVNRGPSTSKRHVLPKRKWHRKPVSRHRWSLHHLQPGTGALHVYRS